MSHSVAHLRHGSGCSFAILLTLTQMYILAWELWLSVLFVCFINNWFTMILVDVHVNLEIKDTKQMS